jgi:hypothetical protein
MATLHFHETTKSTPEQFTAGLRDFGPGRSEIREGKHAKGRVLGFVLGTVGKGGLEKAFAKSVQAIEARNAGGS